MGVFSLTSPSREKLSAFQGYAACHAASLLLGQIYYIDDYTVIVRLNSLLWDALVGFISNRNSCRCLQPGTEPPTVSMEPPKPGVPAKCTGFDSHCSVQSSQGFATSGNRGLHSGMQGNDGEISLIRAARLGLTANIAVLLGLGAAVNATDSSGETVLEQAAASGRAAVVRALLNGGADTNLKVEAN
jgi:hypothetical protein